MPKRKEESPSNWMDTISSLQKEFGKDVIKAYNPTFEGVEKMSTGITALDAILGGGWPKGRIVEIYGAESSGKTTIALTAVAAAQKAGMNCAYIDAESALDMAYAKNIGVDTSTLLLCQPDYGEQGLMITDALIRTGEVSLIVIDSVAALVPKKELDGEIGDANVGLQARMMSQAMRKLAGPAAAMNCTLIFINQIREKVGVMFGNPETTPGGRALKFYASVRLDVRKTQVLKNGDKAYGARTKVKTVKNKTFPPMRVAEFDIVFPFGVDNIGSVVDLAVDLGLLAKGGGGYYTYKDCRKHGKLAMVEFFASDEGKPIFDELNAKVKETISRQNAEDMGIAVDSDAEGEESEPDKAGLTAEEEN